MLENLSVTVDVLFLLTVLGLEPGVVRYPEKSWSDPRKQNTGNGYRNSSSQVDIVRP